MAKSLIIFYAPEATEENLARPGFSLNPCKSCGATCCSQAVPFSIVEALRMAFTLRRTIDSFAEPNYTSKRLPNAWPIKFAGGFGRLEFRTPRYRCVHAGQAVDGQLRCGAWEARPGACRIYPLSVEYGDEPYYVGDEKYCPERWLQDDALRASMASAAHQWELDLAQDKRFVTTWNRGRRKDRSLEAFYTYLLEVVAPQLGYDPTRLLTG